jgi:hypothetical protein
VAAWRRGGVAAWRRGGVETRLPEEQKKSQVRIPPWRLVGFKGTTKNAVTNLIYNDLIVCLKKNTQSILIFLKNVIMICRSVLVLVFSDVRTECS